METKWPHRKATSYLSVFRKITRTASFLGGSKRQKNDGRKFKNHVAKTRVAKTPRPQRGFFDIWPRKKQPAPPSKKTPQVFEGEKDLIYSRSKIDLKTVSKITSIFGSMFDGFGTEFGGFSAPKIDQNRYQFRGRFLEGWKTHPRPRIIQFGSPAASPKDT